MSCTISLFPTSIKLSGIYPIEAVSLNLAFFPTNYEKADKYKEGTWDGRIRLFKKRSQTCPIGLLRPLKQILEREMCAWEIKDYREPVQPQGDSLDLPGKTLWNHQREAAEAFLREKQGIICMPTAAGKTVTAVAITKRIGLPTLFIADSITNMHQIAQAFASELQVDPTSIGLVGGGHDKPADFITVGLAGTLVNRLQSLKRYKLLIIDECHEAAAEQLYEVAINCPAYYRLGLSATPLERPDNSNLKVIAAVGSAIYIANLQELENEGILFIPTIRILKCKDPKLLRRMKWPDVQENGIVNNVYRNKMICDIASRCLTAGRQSLIIVHRIEHGKKLSELLWGMPENFVPNEFINGQNMNKKGKERRLQVVSDFNAGLVPCIISNVFDQGSDFPKLSRAILACGGDSAIKAVQRPGRTMRRPEDKEPPIFYDFADTFHRYPARHSYARITRYEDGNYPIEYYDRVEHIKEI